MPLSFLSKVWGLVGAFLAVYTLNAWSRSQGGPSFGKDLLLDGRPIIDSFYATVVVSLLLAFVSLVALTYARRCHGRRWQERVPIPWFDEAAWSKANPNDPVFKAFASALLLLFIALPAASLVHFNGKVLKYGVVWNPAASSVPLLRVADVLPWIGVHRANPVLAAENARGDVELRLASNHNDALMSHDPNFNPSGNNRPSQPCAKDRRVCAGITWFRYASPVLVGILTLGAWLLASRLLFVVFAGTGRRPRKGGPAHSRQLRVP